MNNVFWIFLGLNVLISTPTFWLLNELGKRQGDVPADSALTHHGRRYSVWWEETTLIIGNGICFSLMDGAFASGMSSLAHDDGLLDRLWLGVGVSIGGLVTFKWYRDATKMYKENEAWGWQWCGPTASDQSFAGIYHTLYFWGQASIIATGLIYLVWQPISMDVRGFFLFGLAGYGASFVHFVKMQKRLADMYNRPRK